MPSRNSRSEVNVFSLDSKRATDRVREPVGGGIIMPKSIDMSAAMPGVSVEDLSEKNDVVRSLTGGRYNATSDNDDSEPFNFNAEKYDSFMVDSELGSTLNGLSMHSDKIRQLKQGLPEKKDSSTMLEIKKAVWAQRQSDKA